ncbi:hypothetical protein [Tepidibacter thalassicus]|uniref:Uncharacterized protein n=1 Tax=Tepidibacter thalassicus DSM 15285 TaxID=1123350 RepID=A0A1M5TZJ7_9FIRM|nr:hypothetical protein [Tepidibacter thalassicus]SHH56212.1 hypothetical protein SAMN02744040_02347 [Tepidibacter thalassicus DSM 15285]
MNNKKILYFNNYISKINKDEIQRKELMDLIKKVVNSIRKEKVL